MKSVALVLVPVATIAAVAAILPFTVHAARPDFDTVVSAVQQRYGTHPQKIPLMGLVSLCARVATGDGVKGLKIAEFDNLPAAPDTAELDSLVRDSLGSAWQPFVVDRSRSGDLSVIYVQPDGQAMRMMIADYDHGELDLVRIEVNGERLARWMHDPGENARHHSYTSDGSGTPD
jgi:hypothetical protein